MLGFRFVVRPAATAHVDCVRQGSVGSEANADPQQSQLGSRSGKVETLARKPG